MHKLDEKLQNYTMPEWCHNTIQHCAKFHLWTLSVLSLPSEDNGMTVNRKCGAGNHKLRTYLLRCMCHMICHICNGNCTHIAESLFSHSISFRARSFVSSIIGAIIFIQLGIIRLQKSIIPTNSHAFLFRGILFLTSSSSINLWTDCIILKAVFQPCIAM